MTLHPHYRANILCSYHYFGTRRMADYTGQFKAPPRLFIDSGAWSAFSQGVHINLNDYIRWLKANRDVIDVYVNLDDLRDPDITWRNQKTMEAAGLTDTLPVVHMGEPLDILTKYLDAGYKYIGLGRMVGRATKPVGRWLATCFRMAEPYGAVFHGLGLTRWGLLSALKFHSVDSTSWASGLMYGMVRVFDPRTRRWQICRVGDRTTVTALGSAIRLYGIEPRQLYDRDLYEARFAAQVCGGSVKACELFLRSQKGEIPVPGSPADPGLHNYLAESSGNWQVHAERGIHHYLNRTIKQGTTT